MGGCIPGPVVEDVEAVEDVVQLREPGRDLGWHMLCCCKTPHQLPSSTVERERVCVYGEEAHVAFAAQFSATTAHDRWMRSVPMGGYIHSLAKVGTGGGWVVCLLVSCSGDERSAWTTMFHLECHLACKLEKRKINPNEFHIKSIVLTIDGEGSATNERDGQP
jgi:hypothetical protein